MKCGSKKMAMGGMAGRAPMPNAKAMGAANPNARFMKKGGMAKMAGGGTVRGAGAATKGKKFAGCH